MKLQVINNNNQIYNYIGQKARNDKVLEFAKPLLGDDFDYTQYPNFEYTEEPKDETTDKPTDDVYDLLGREETIPNNDPDLPF